VSDPLIELLRPYALPPGTPVDIETPAGVSSREANAIAAAMRDVVLGPGAGHDPSSLEERIWATLLHEALRAHGFEVTAIPAPTDLDELAAFLAEQGLDPTNRARSGGGLADPARGQVGTEQIACIKAMRGRWPSLGLKQGRDIVFELANQEVNRG
jgi:hypothetical protein